MANNIKKKLDNEGSVKTTSANKNKVASSKSKATVKKNLKDEVKTLNKTTTKKNTTKKETTNKKTNIDKKSDSNLDKVKSTQAEKRTDSKNPHNKSEKRQRSLQNKSSKKTNPEITETTKREIIKSSKKEIGNKETNDKIKKSKGIQQRKSRAKKKPVIDDIDKSEIKSSKSEIGNKDTSDKIKESKGIQQRKSRAKKKPVIDDIDKSEIKSSKSENGNKDTSGKIKESKGNQQRKSRAKNESTETKDKDKTDDDTKRVPKKYTPKSKLETISDTSSQIKSDKSSLEKSHTKLNKHNTNREVKQSKSKGIKQDKSNTNQNKEKAKNQLKTKDANKTQKQHKTNEKHESLKKNEPKFIHKPLLREAILSETEKKESYYYEIFRKIKHFLFEELYIDREISILIGVSGGVDSIVLLDILANLSYDLKLNLYIAHFNHQLRDKESEEDQKFVQDLAKKYGIEFFTKSENIRDYSEKNKLGLENAGRIKRYKFFESVILSQNIDVLATAHNKNDQAETFLMNLFRGSGLQGLSSIPARRKFVKNSFIVRPILYLSKDEILEYARRRGLKWFEDKSNKDINFTRNRIRHKLLPEIEREYNPKVVDLLNNTAKIMTGAEEFISEYINNHLDKLVITKSNEKIEVNLQLLNSYSEFFQTEIIRKLLNKHFGIRSLSIYLTNSIVDLSSKSTGTVIEVTENLKVLKDRNSLIFTNQKFIKEEQSILIKNQGEYELDSYKLSLTQVKKSDIKIGNSKYIEYFDFEFMPQYLEIRTWREGDIFRPLGLNGTMKLSDFLSNEKVSLLDKKKVLVLTDRVNIIWIMGMRISDYYSIKSDTRKFLKAELKNYPSFL